MEAMRKLRGKGLSTAQIAAGLGCSKHLVRAYERYERFPSRHTYICIVELAEAHGLKLAARDFIQPATEVSCEPSGND